MVSKKRSPFCFPSCLPDCSSMFQHFSFLLCGTLLWQGTPTWRMSRFESVTVRLRSWEQIVLFAPFLGVSKGRLELKKPSKRVQNSGSVCCYSGFQYPKDSFPGPHFYSELNSSMCWGTDDTIISNPGSIQPPRPETGVATALDFMLGLDGETPIAGLVRSLRIVLLREVRHGVVAAEGASNVLNAWFGVFVFCA